MAEAKEVEKEMDFSDFSTPSEMIEAGATWRQIRDRFENESHWPEENGKYQDVIYFKTIDSNSAYLPFFKTKDEALLDFARRGDLSEELLDQAAIYSDVDFYGFYVANNSDIGFALCPSAQVIESEYPKMTVEQFIEDGENSPLFIKCYRDEYGSDSELFPEDHVWFVYAKDDFGHLYQTPVCEDSYLDDLSQMETSEIMTSEYGDSLDAFDEVIWQKGDMVFGRVEEGYIEKQLQGAYVLANIHDGEGYMDTAVIGGRDFHEKTIDSFVDYLDDKHRKGELDDPEPLNAPGYWGYLDRILSEDKELEKLERIEKKECKKEAEKKKASKGTEREMEI